MAQSEQPKKPAVASYRSVSHARPEGENCPTGKSPIAVKTPLSSPFFRLAQNISVHPVGQIKTTTVAVSPEEGRIASRHERAVGCDGRDSVGRARDRRAVLP
jgi:hypothetical protein